MRARRLLPFIPLLYVTASCGGATHAPAPPAAKAKPKSVILMIGDGMGPQQVGLLEAYATRAPHSIYGVKPTAMHQLMDEGQVALSRHHPEGAVVVDSACSATQLAGGEFSGSEMIGLNAEGRVVQTVIERGVARGKATGIVSDTRLTHATPAAFAAHVAHRSMENEIAPQMLAAKVDVLLSGGLRHWVPKGYDKAAMAKRTGKAYPLSKSKRQDDRDLLAEAKAAGYSLVFDREGLDEAGDKVLGLFSWSGMADGITTTATRDSADRREPTLKEMSMAALERLSKDPDGFVLVIEGGQIDWAGHGNDAGTLLHEMIKFDEAVGAVYDWVKAQPDHDVLLVVTADHETGSFGLSYSRNDLPEGRKLPGVGFDGLTYRPGYNFGRLNNLDRLYGQSMTFSEMAYRLEKAIRASPNVLKVDYEADAPEVIAEKLGRQAKILMEVFNAHSEFKIDEAQALRVVQMEPNAHHFEGEYRDGQPHKSMQERWVPRFDEFEAFYVGAGADIKGLMGRAVAEQQGIVWGTGTHTHTPVPVMSYGPGSAQLRGMLHHVEIGRALKGMVE